MFQRLIEIVVAGILKTVEYLADILVTGASEEKHQVNLKNVQRRLTEAGLCLKKDTCNFGVDTMEYLGNPIGKDGLTTVDKRIRVVIQLNPHTSHKSFHSWTS